MDGGTVIKSARFVTFAVLAFSGSVVPARAQLSVPSPVQAPNVDQGMTTPCTGGWVDTTRPDATFGPGGKEVRTKDSSGLERRLVLIGPNGVVRAITVVTPETNSMLTSWYTETGEPARNSLRAKLDPDSHHGHKVAITKAIDLPRVDIPAAAATSPLPSGRMPALDVTLPDDALRHGDYVRVDGDNWVKVHPTTGATTHRWISDGQGRGRWIGVDQPQLSTGSHQTPSRPSVAPTVPVSPAPTGANRKVPQTAAVATIADPSGRHWIAVRDTLGHITHYVAVEPPRGAHVFSWNPAVGAFVLKPLPATGPSDLSTEPPVRPTHPAPEHRSGPQVMPH